MMEAILICSLIVACLAALPFTGCFRDLIDAQNRVAQAAEKRNALYADRTRHIVGLWSDSNRREAVPAILPFEGDDR